MKIVKFIFLFLPISALAQTISMDQTPIEDALRRLQLMGKMEQDLSFMSRPIQPRKINGWDSALYHMDSSFFKKGLHPISKKFLGKFGYATILPFQVTQQFVTDHPFQELDGPMIGSSGSQTMVSGGVFLKLGPLTIQYQPQFVWAANTNFRGTQQTPNFRYPDPYFYDHYKNDLIFNPVLDNRFLQKNLIGQSSIRLNLGPASIGLSSENITWGPAVMNPLIMSSHAPGFMHVSFNSRKPLRTTIGSIEWQLAAAYLDEINPAYRGVARNYMGFGTDQTRDEKRYFNGGMVSYQPKWIKGLSVGVSRVVQQPELVLRDFPQWNLIFRNVSREKDPSQISWALLYDIETNRDQVASIFMRWLWQEAHAEFYAEWGRNDAFYNMRDFLQRPEHSRAYTYGFRKLIGYNASSPRKYWLVMSEFTRLQQPSTWPALSAGYWYVHGGYRPKGYTHLGQIMGAPIGSGGNYQMIRVSKFNGMQQLGIQLERTDQNADIFEMYNPLLPPTKNKWVDIGLRLLYDHPIHNILISTTFIAKQSFNYNWSQPTASSGLGLSNSNDLSSFLFKIAIRYL
ncbi:MAG: hypothetical protein ACK5AO_02125 [bacterium]|jgi:hypothetical protein